MFGITSLAELARRPLPPTISGDHATDRITYLRRIGQLPAVLVWARNAGSSYTMTVSRDEGTAGCDLYEVLGVDPAAELSQIRRAYRSQALLLHPDRNPDPGATAHFRAVAAAYAVLADPERRANYDAARCGPPPDSDGAPTADSDSTSSGAGGDYVPVSDPVAYTDYAPAREYPAPPPPPQPPPPPARPVPPPWAAARTPLPEDRLPGGWPIGRIDHRRRLGRLLLWVWRLAPLPRGGLAAFVVVVGVYAVLVLARFARHEFPVLSVVIWFLAEFALICWTVRGLTLLVLRFRDRSARRSRGAR